MTWKNDKWDTGECHSMAKDCSWSDKFQGRTIHISPEVWGAIRRLCKEIESEWQMLLCGVENTDGVFVDSYWIPKQEVTPSTVKNLDIIDSKVVKEKKIVATIHSHAGMGVFFSHTDTEFTNLSLIKTHLVTNNKGELCATHRYSLPCGLDKFFDCPIETAISSDVVNGIENITKKTYEMTNYQQDNINWDTDKRKYRKSKKKHAILELNAGEATLFNQGGMV